MTFEVETLSFGLAVILALCSLVWWLSTQFKDTRKLIYDKVEQLQRMFMEKLEYHERHDDQRFQSITNDLWNIKVRNASRDGYGPNKELEKETL